MQWRVVPLPRSSGGTMTVADFARRGSHILMTGLLEPDADVPGAPRVEPLPDGAGSRVATDGPRNHLYLGQTTGAAVAWRRVTGPTGGMLIDGVHSVGGQWLITGICPSGGSLPLQHPAAGYIGSAAGRGGDTPQWEEVPTPSAWTCRDHVIAVADNGPRIYVWATDGSGVFGWSFRVGDSIAANVASPPAELTDGPDGATSLPQATVGGKFFLFGPDPAALGDVAPAALGRPRAKGDAHLVPARLDAPGRGTSVDGHRGARFDPATGEWDLLPRAPVIVSGAVAVGTKLAVSDGVRVSVYDPGTRTWSKVFSPPDQAAHARSGATVISCGPTIVVWGGTTKTGASGVPAQNLSSSGWSFDTGRSSWAALPLDGARALAAARAGEVAGGSILFLGKSVTADSGRRSTGLLLGGVPGCGAS